MVATGRSEGLNVEAPIAAAARIEGPFDRAEHSVGVGGLGYMGLATALAFAHHGVRVRGYDLRAELRRSLRSAELPIFEQGLDGLLRDELDSGRFEVVDSWEDLVRTSPVLFVCLPTPRRPSGRIDLGPMRAGLNELGRALRGTEEYRLVVVKSTVVPGTTERTLRPLLERVSRKSAEELGVAVAPEFLAEGSMVQDALRPARIVLGVDRPADEARLRRLHARFPSPVVTVSPTGAELAKYASNAFLALKVSFANEFSRLAERTGTDVGDVMAAVGLDPRIGPRFLSAGPGFGGSCFEKDVRALLARGKDLGLDLRLLKATLATNDAQTRHAAELALRALGPPEGRTVALLGLAFKRGTDDVRESRAIPIAEILLRAGASVRVHDPVALERFRSAAQETFPEWADRLTYCPSVEEALRGADLAVLHTDWPEYADWPVEWSATMRRSAVVDLRRAMPRSVRERGDLEWYGLGSPAVPGAAASGAPAMPSWLRVPGTLPSSARSSPLGPTVRTAGSRAPPSGRWSVRRS